MDAVTKHLYPSEFIMIAAIYFFADRLAVALVTAFKNLIGGLSFRGRVGKVRVEATFTTVA